MTFNDDVQLLLDILPTPIVERITYPEDLMEIVLDLGRPLELRYSFGEPEFHDDYLITEGQIKEVTRELSSFGPDNRAGINGTLHRISRIQNRHGDCIGLTCRVGKPFYGSIDLLKDLVDSGNNILLLGAPGKGKTSRLRDAARYLSTESKKKVVIIDTSNEIAGDGNVSHEAVGRARRLQVPFEKTQHSVMIEAVENHTPDIIIIDEISASQEVQAARTIAQRGVQLIATAHGRKLEDLLNNPPLADLVGGVSVVTLSDDLAKQRGLISKTIQERKTDPTFSIVVELLNFEEIAIHLDVKDSVDAILAGGICRAEERRILGGEVRVVMPAKVILPTRIDEPKAVKTVPERPIRGRRK
jgi:stage III sporulation protein SpoIIIAA